MSYSNILNGHLTVTSLNLKPACNTRNILFAHSPRLKFEFVRNQTSAQSINGEKAINAQQHLQENRPAYESTSCIQGH